MLLTAVAPTPGPVPVPRPAPHPVPVPRPAPHPKPVPYPVPHPHPTPVPHPGPHPHPTPVPHPGPHPHPTPVPHPHPVPVPMPNTSIDLVAAAFGRDFASLPGFQGMSPLAATPKNPASLVLRFRDGAAAAAADGVLRDVIRGVSILIEAPGARPSEIHTEEINRAAVELPGVEGFQWMQYAPRQAGIQQGEATNKIIMWTKNQPSLRVANEILSDSFNQTPVIPMIWHGEPSGKR